MRRRAVGRRLAVGLNVDAEARLLRRGVAADVLAPQQRAVRRVDQRQPVARAAGERRLLIREHEHARRERGDDTSCDVAGPAICPAPPATRNSVLSLIAVPCSVAVMSPAAIVIPTDCMALTSAAAAEIAGEGAAAAGGAGHQCADGADETSVAIEQESRITLEHRQTVHRLIDAHHPQAAAAAHAFTTEPQRRDIAGRETVERGATG